MRSYFIYLTLQSLHFFAGGIRFHPFRRIKELPSGIADSPPSPSPAPSHRPLCKDANAPVPCTQDYLVSVSGTASSPPQPASSTDSDPFVGNMAGSGVNGELFFFPLFH